MQASLKIFLNSLFFGKYSAAKLLGWIVVCFLQSAGRFWFAKVHKFFGTPCRNTYCIFQCLFSTETFCRSLVVFCEVKTSILFDLSYYTTVLYLYCLYLCFLSANNQSFGPPIYILIYLEKLNKSKRNNNI